MNNFVYFIIRSKKGTIFGPGSLTHESGAGRNNVCSIGNRIAGNNCCAQRIRVITGALGLDTLDSMGNLLAYFLPAAIAERG